MPAFGTYATYDSAYIDDVVRGLATLVEPRNTVTWDLIPEDAPFNSKEFVWYDAVYYDLSGAVGAGGWTAVATAGLDVTPGFADIVQIGDVVRVEDEVVVVSAVNRGADTIDVFARGHGSTVGAAHAAAVPLYIVGSAHVEGTVDQEGLLEENAERKNYSQIVEEAVILTKTASNQAYKDVADKLDEERARAMSRALRKLNSAVLLGELDAGSVSTPRSCGGIEYWLRETPGAVNDDFGGAFTEAQFKATLETIQKRGGAPDTVIMSVEMKSVFNDLNNTIIQTDRLDSEAGTIIDFYQADGIGRLRLVADPRLPDSLKTMYIVNSQKLAKAWFVDDALRFVPETANSRTVRETLQGQFSFRMKDVTTDHARIFNM